MAQFFLTRIPVVRSAWLVKALSLLCIYKSPPALAAQTANCDEWMIYQISGSMELRTSDDVLLAHHLSTAAWAKHLVNTCPPEKLRPKGRNITLNKELIAELDRTMPARLIEYISDPQRTPFGSMEGKIGEIVSLLKRTFKLSVDQQERLRAAIQKLEERSRKFFKDIEGKCRDTHFDANMIPPTDQKNSDTCFAQSSALQIGMQTLSPTELKRDPVSPAAIDLIQQRDQYARSKSFFLAAGPKASRGEAPIGVNDERTAFAAVKKYGVCRKSEVSDQYFDLLNGFHSIDDYKKVFPKLSKTQIKSGLSDDPWRTLESLMKMACPNPLSMSELDIEAKSVDYPWTPERQLGLVKDMQSRVLGGEKVGIVASSTFHPGSHAMVVMGMEKNKKNGLCDFIVRNNYGPDCGLSRPGFPAHYLVRCDGQGNFRMSAATLAEYLRSMNWIHRANSANSGTAEPTETSK